MATNLIDKVVETLIASGKVDNRVDALNHIQEIHDKSCGLYYFAAQHNVLAENSAAELSIQFYTAYNDEIYPRY